MGGRNRARQRPKPRSLDGEFDSQTENAGLVKRGIELPAYFRQPRGEARLRVEAGLGARQRILGGAQAGRLIEDGRGRREVAGGPISGGRGGCGRL